MKTALLAVIVVVAVVAILVRLVESRLAFFPLRGETTTPRQYGVNYKEAGIKTVDGETLHAWVLPADAGSSGAGRSEPRADVLYFHGNGGNLSLWAPILVAIARQGYSVTAMDYRGYGRSTGRPTERGLYRDVDAIVRHFWDTRTTTKPVIYWGRSLGGAMAAYAATVRPPDGIVLESSFPDVRSLMSASRLMAGLTLLSSMRLPAAAFMRRVKVPTLVIHGDRDSVIPYQQGRALYAQIPGPKSFVTIAGGDHNDSSPRDPGAYWDAVNGFSAGL